MPTLDRREALSGEGARARVAEIVFPPWSEERRSACDGPEGHVGCVGLEPEYFAVRVDARGRPAGRVPLEGPDGVLETLGELSLGDPDFEPFERAAGEAPVFRLRDAGRITFEPGAQIEHSTAVHQTSASALRDVDSLLTKLDAAFAARSATIASAGIDLWHPLEAAPQQLDAPRYRAMHAYLSARGSGGTTMMRHTASQQINLDMGWDDVRRERYLLANLASPLVTATFAASPGDGFVSARARAWQTLDPTRTGFPRALVEGGSCCPAEVYAEAALDADVMFVRESSTNSIPMAGDWSFRTWIADGHPDLGFPTREDFDLHLTTLFLEVRPRGFLELRAPDCLPPRWRAAPVVLLTGLLYCPRARGRALELLEGTLPELSGLWERAARAGLADEELGALAPRLWEIALDGAGGMGPEAFGPEHLATAERFLERFPARRRAPSDEIRELLARGPEQVLNWARGGCEIVAGQDGALV